MERTDNWSKLGLDENGEPTVTSTLQLLGVGNHVQAQQLGKLITRWNLRPRPGALTTFYGNRSLAQAMAKQLRDKSGDQYNLLHIRYNPTTADIEVSPKQITEKVHYAPSRKELREQPNADEQRQQLEQEREKALSEASKPWMQLDFITDPKLLNTKVKQTVQVEDSDEELEREITIGKLQAPVKREFEILRKLLACI